MALPKTIRSRVPDRVRDHPAVRALALGAGLIPPRPMHSPAEAESLGRLAAGARCVVEIGVYEGSSAFVFCDVMAVGAELHLIDPFVDSSGAALPPGWHATPLATRAAVARRARASGGGPEIRWHIARSQDVGRAWRGRPVDRVFIDGDHSEAGCREDWDVWHPHVRVGGAVAFHDARAGQPGGAGSAGVSAVVEELLRRCGPPAGWRISAEVDTLVVVERSPG
jgi:predicted O-methyltransferase YrrM